MARLAEHRQSWTFAHLQELPENGGNDVDWRRFEIVDGALVVSPSASSLHELLVMYLGAAIRDAMPDGFATVGSLGIDLDRSYLVPDLVVAKTAVLLAGVPMLNPVDTQLAVEIVSPSSRTMDRVTKPAQYAAAGIPGYWRVETDRELTLTAYALDPGATTYTELGTWHRGQITQIERPFLARVAIDELLPRA